MSSNLLQPTSTSLLFRTWSMAIAMMLLMLVPSLAQAQTNNTASLSILSDGDQYEAQGVFTVQVSLDYPVVSTGNVTSVTINVTADVTPLSGLTATFGEGEQVKTLNFTTNDNGVDNAHANMTADIAVVSGEARDFGSSDSATIFDDDGPAIYFSLEETDGIEDAIGNFTATVHTAGWVDTFQDIDFYVNTTGSTATIGGLEEEAFSGALDQLEGLSKQPPSYDVQFYGLDGGWGTINENTSNTTFIVSIVADDDSRDSEEYNETIEFAFSNTDEQTDDASDTASFDITDDDVFVSIYWDEEESDWVNVTEGESVGLVAELDHESPYDVTFDLNFVNEREYTIGPQLFGPAIPGADYYIETTSLTIESGDTTPSDDTVISATPDDVFEVTDEVTVNLIGAVSVSGGSATMNEDELYMSIINTNAPPAMSISSSESSLDEADGYWDEEPAGYNYTYTVELDEPAGEDAYVFVNFNTDYYDGNGYLTNVSAGVDVTGGFEKTGEQEYDDEADVLLDLDSPYLDGESSGDGQAIVIAFIGAGNTTASIGVWVLDDEFDEIEDAERVNTTINFGVFGDSEIPFNAGKGSGKSGFKSYQRTFGNSAGKQSEPDEDEGLVMQETSENFVDINDDDDYYVSLTTLLDDPYFVEDAEADDLDRKVIVLASLSDNPTVDSDITINVTIALEGSALEGYDYDLDGVEDDEIVISIPPGETGSVFELEAIDDSIYEKGGDDETVNLTIVEATNASFDPADEDGSDQLLTVYLEDDEDMPGIYVTTLDDEIEEYEVGKDGPDYTEVLFGMTHASDEPIFVNASISGTANYDFMEVRKGLPEGDLNSTDVYVTLEDEDFYGLEDLGETLWSGAETEDDYGLSNLTIVFGVRTVDDSHDEDVAGQEPGETMTWTIHSAEGAQVISAPELDKGNSPPSESSVTITVVDNDDVPTVDVRNAEYAKAEGWVEDDNQMLEVYLSHLSVNDVSVTMDFDGSADGSDMSYVEKSFGEFDYEYESANVTVSSGNVTSSFWLYGNDDDIDEDVLGEEPGETVNITVVSVVNGTTDESSGHFQTLEDNDDVPSVYFSVVDSAGDDVEAEVDEPESAPTKSEEADYYWLAELSHRSVNDVNLSVVCDEYEGEGTASPGCNAPKDGHLGADYVTDQWGTISAGGTNVSKALWVTDDLLDEWDEYAGLTANSTTAAAVMLDADQDGSKFYGFQIIDNDDPVTYTLVQTESLLNKDGVVELTEGLGGGTDTANYTVVLSAISGKSVLFDVEYSDGELDGEAIGYEGCLEPSIAGTADTQAAKGCSVPGADFYVSDTSLWIQAGNMTADFSVVGQSDELNEGTETGYVSASVNEDVDKGPQDPTAEPGEVTEASFDILDDDKAPVANDDNIAVAEDGYVMIDVLAGHEANSSDPAAEFAASEPDMDEDYCEVGKACALVDLLDLESGPGDGAYTLPEFGTLQTYAEWLNTTNVTKVSKLVEPQFVYTPNPDYSGLDSFTYLLDDGKGLPSNATVTLYVVGENDKPNSIIDRATTDEDTPIVIDVLANDVDPDNDTLTVTAVAQGDDGEVDGIATLVDGVVTFTPAENFNGLARFEYTVSDGFLSDSDPVEVTVVAINDAPTAVDDAAATPYETGAIVDVLANDSDVEGDAFSVTEVTTPTNGVTVLNEDGTVSYTPNADFMGVDTFVYTVAEDADAEVTSNATVSVTVGDNPNNVPVAVADEAEVDSGASVDIDVAANDTDADDGAVLTVTLGTAPAEDAGSVVLNDDGTITFTAAAEFVGEASFTYNVSDGTDSTEGTVTVTVNAPVGNAAPVAVDDSGSVTAGESVTIGVLTNDTDPEGDTLTITIISQPAAGQGTVTDNGDGTLTYTAPADFEGDTSFTYTIEDSEGNASTAEVAINVSPDLDGISTEEEDGVDGDGDGTPDGDGNGDGVEDSEQTNVSSLTVQTDENEAQQGQYITVSVETDGDDPDDDSDDTTDDAASLSNVESIANPDPATFPEGATAPIGFLSFQVTKAEVGASSKVVIRIPDGATVTDYYKYGKTPDNQVDHWYAFTYDPVTNTGAQIDNVNGKITLNFVDGLRGDNDLTANGVVDDPGVPVFLTNEAPVAAADAATIDEDNSATIAVLDNDTDADEDALLVSSVSTPENGTVEINTDGTITYTPNAHYNGTDSFTYNVTDNRGETVQATVTVTINSVDDLPVAAADEAETAEDTDVMVDIFANDFHPDDIPFFLVQISDPDNGTAVYHNDGTLTYTPDANYAGTETFTYTIGDSRGADSFVVGTVTIVVTGADDAPIGVADASTTEEDNPVSISVTDNDSDPDGDAISVGSLTQPTNGTATDNGDGTITYTPEADFAGEDMFTYTLTDGTNPSAAVEVSVTVTPVNDAPAFAEGDAISTAADPFFLDADYAFDYVAATDVDSDNLTYMWEISLASTFAEVTYSAEITGGSAAVTAADLIAVLEPLGLTADSELMVYQRVTASDGELDGSSAAQQITFARAANVSNESLEIPTEYFLSGNYPNPFNPSTTIEFGLPEAADVSIVLFDMTGRQVQVVTQAQLAAGVHTVNVQMGDLPSGLYVYRLVAGSKVFSKTMHLIK